jgi:hypothetical protein
MPYVDVSSTTRSAHDTMQIIRARRHLKNCGRREQSLREFMKICLEGTPLCFSLLMHIIFNFKKETINTSARWQQEVHWLPGYEMGLLRNNYACYCAVKVQFLNDVF